MKNSSVQLELDYPENSTASRIQGLDIEALDSGMFRTTDPTIGFSHFTTYTTEFAQNAKMAGRILAASVSDEEHRALLNERQRLLDKKFARTITRKETNRLTYVRWSLDRIEDARHGPAMDLLEGIVSKYEQFLAEVRAFQNELREAAAKK